MKYDNIFSRDDIVLAEDLTIELILNENYSELRRCINSYFMSLLLDIKIGAECGYSFYNDLLDDYYIHEDETFMAEIYEVRREIKFFESMIIVENKGEDELLDIFLNETSKEYKLIERELLTYIKLIKNIIADKVRM
ncbi:hypothetical protein [Romboutsia hominis]|uniref:hypothetical protein n=1 Tax=Romboutsia hominis TaxID=1507512 RepID=UPI001F05B6B2|nr:hypothetical protein [Romboutsia hominis]MCH1959699.1 hypothetical protein [Romboutsia hominis]MCH1969878.1 hypothetical protein [Romboutsia hominis]